MWREQFFVSVLDLSEIRGSTDLFQDCALFFFPLVRDKEPIFWKNRFLKRMHPIKGGEDGWRGKRKGGLYWRKRSGFLRENFVFETIQEELKNKNKKIKNFSKQG